MKEGVVGGLRLDVVAYLTDALKIFDKVGPTKTRTIGVEVTLLGHSGLEINNPAKKYKLKTCLAISRTCTCWRSCMRPSSKSTRVRIGGGFCGRVYGGKKDFCQAMNLISYSAADTFDCASSTQVAALSAPSRLLFLGASHENQGPHRLICALNRPGVQLNSWIGVNRKELLEFFMKVLKIRWHTNIPCLSKSRHPNHQVHE